MIKISIITITYNAGVQLSRTAESVLTQSYPDVEHLIIDGASTDDTLKRAHDYQRQSLATSPHEVRIVSEPDDGLYYAMNKGLDLATGDYVVFLNAGDTLPNDHTLKKVVATARFPQSRYVDPDTAPRHARIAKLPAVDKDAPLPAVIYGDTDITDGEGHFLRHRRLCPPKGGLSWRSFKRGMLVCHQAFYARRDIARQCQYNTAYHYSADVDWCIRVMKKAEEQGSALRNVHAVVANYLSEGQTTAHHRESLMERFRIMRHHYGLLTTVARHISFVFRG